MVYLKNIAILGYGPQGRAWAQNLADSGFNVTIGLRSQSRLRKLARKDGMKNVTTFARAVKQADCIVFAFPDHLHGKIFRKDIEPNLREGATLVFLSGYSIHFKTIEPPDNCDIILLAPLGPGAAVREKYNEGGSIGFFHAVHQNGSGQAKKRLEELIQGLKIPKNALIKTTFADEAIGDLFGEQAILCGGLTGLIKAGYDILIDAGLSSEKAYLEVAYQLDLIVDLIKKYGISGMYDRISIAARYGSLLSGPEIIDKNTRKSMKKVLDDITSGRFANKLEKLDDNKIRKIKSDLKRLSSPNFERSVHNFSPLKKKH